MSNRLYKRHVLLPLTLLIPGAAHCIAGLVRPGVILFALHALHICILGLSWEKERLPWQALGTGNWLPFVVLLVLDVSVLLISIVSISRIIYRPGSIESLATRSYWSMVGQKFANNTKGLSGLLLLIVFAYMALFAPFLANQDPYEMDFYNTLAPPSPEHPLGTDQLGRDVLARLIFGSRVALGIGVSATVVNVMFGGLLGLIAGYTRGMMDAFIMRFLEVINSIPFLVLALLVVSLWGGGLLTLIMVLGVLGLWPARIVRSEVLSIREEEFVSAAHALGASSMRIIFKHILPNALTGVIVVATMNVGTNILTVASLSFLGMGVPPPTPSWGGMLKEAQEFIYSAWWLAAFPGLCISLAVFAFSMLGDALRDVLDPKLK